MLIVEAKIFSMNFDMVREFDYANIKFKRLEDYNEIHRKILKERRHDQTGLAIVKIPQEILDPDQAIKYAISILDKCSILLSFAHNYDVFFNEYACYEIKNDKPELKTRQTFSIRVGRAVGGLNIYSHGLKDFLSIAMPLIQDKKFVEKTGIYRTLLFYNEAVAYGSNVVEVKFPTLWVALEILANSYIKSNPKEFVLSKEKWSQLIKGFKKLLTDDLKIVSKETVNKLCGILGSARKGSIVDKVSYLLDGYELDQYRVKIPSFNKMRNDILHGRTLNYNSKPSPIDFMMELEKLLVKIILKTLNFYDRENLIHSSILKEDLLARV